MKGKIGKIVPVDKFHISVRHQRKIYCIRTLPLVFFCIERTLKLLINKARHVRVIICCTRRI